MANHKEANNRGTSASSVNPQGHGQERKHTNPKSELENRAKKSNTKI